MTISRMITAPLAAATTFCASISLRGLTNPAGAGSWMT